MTQTEQFKRMLSAVPLTLTISVFLVTLILLAVLVGRQPPVGLIGSNTPDQAMLAAVARRSSENHISTWSNFHILGTRRWSSKALLIISYETTRFGVKKYNVGYQRANSELTGWHLNSRYSEGFDSNVVTLPPNALVCYGISLGNDSAGNYSIAWGRAAVPAVTSVEVDFDQGINRRTLRDTTAGGVFAVQELSTVRPTQLRLFGTSNELLHTVDILASDLQAQGSGAIAGMRCKP